MAKGTVAVCTDGLHGYAGDPPKECRVGATPLPGGLPELRAGMPLPEVAAKLSAWSKEQPSGRGGATRVVDFSLEDLKTSDKPVKIGEDTLQVSQPKGGSTAMATIKGHRFQLKLPKMDLTATAGSNSTRW